MNRAENTALFYLFAAPVITYAVLFLPMNTLIIKISRILVLLTLSLGFHQTTVAQVYYNPDAVKAITDESKLYVGIASGFESYAGILGVSLEGNVAHNFSLYAGVGLGGWGYKLSGGMKFYKSYPYKWAYCVSISHATGAKDVKIRLETQSGTQQVQMELLPVQTLNITAQHHWKIGNKNNRFNVEFGISLGFKSNAYVIKNGYTLTQTSSTAMAIQQPGGLVGGIGFTFGK